MVGIIVREADPEAIILFGSRARGEAGPHSDVDILVVASRHGPREAAIWDAQLDQLAQHVVDWSGNHCEVLELTEAELADARVRNDRLVTELRTDAIALGGRDIRLLLTASQASA